MCGSTTEVDFVRRAAIEIGMWAEFVVPVDEQFELTSKRTSAVSHESEFASAFLFQRPNGAFDDSDASMLAGGAETRLEATFLAPCLEAVATENRVLVGDDVLRRVGRSGDASAEEDTHCLRVWPLLENSKRHQPS